MKELAENYIKSYEGYGKWVKFILNFIWTIPTNLYRCAKSAKNNDVLGIVLSLILLFSFGGCGVLAVFDFITIALKDKVYWLDDLNGYEAVTLNDEAKPAEEKKDGDADKID